MSEPVHERVVIGGLTFEMRPWLGDLIVIVIEPDREEPCLKAEQWQSLLAFHASAEAMRVEVERLRVREQQLVRDINREKYEHMATINQRDEALSEGSHLANERDDWKRRAIAHGCDAEKGDPDCG